MKNLKQTPNNDELLELYALFKQATVGDVNTGLWHVIFVNFYCKNSHGIS